jgi:hypothetical protein
MVPNWSQPSNPENLEALLHRFTTVVEPCFHMVDTQYAGIPVWVVRRRFPRKDHNVGVCPRVNSVVLSPHVICSIIHLHGLDGVDCVVGDDN